MRLIDADALVNAILTEHGFDPKYTASYDIDGIKAYADSLIMERLNEQPTVDAVPKSELFELFDRITTAWNGKQRFFPQDDGTIYDRNKCDYVKSLYDAVNRFCNELHKDEYVPVVHGEWLEDDSTYCGANHSNYKCSLCSKIGGSWLKGLKQDELPNYCGNCGAKMDLTQSNESNVLDALDGRSKTMSDLISRQDAIDAVGNMLRRKFGIGGELAKITLEGLPSAQTEIIRCKDCKHFAPNKGYTVGWDGYCDITLDKMLDDDYCSKGAVRTT